MYITLAINNQIMSTADNDNNKDDKPNICANCGKGEEGSVSLKACTACKLVKYCNRECQIAHRPQHKKDCKKRAAELHDQKLFKQPPPECGDCPICFLRLPSLDTGSRYMSCCGKFICSGCIHAVQSRATKKEHNICPFCRKPPLSNEETIKRYEERVEMNDPIAFLNMGGFYVNGQFGLPQNIAKALELWHRAGELGNSQAYNNIGSAYDTGDGVEVDEKKSQYYYELAAVGGCSIARYNLGCEEWNSGKMDRALKHWMIAARDGYSDSLKNINILYTNGDASKQDYAEALRAYQEYLDEIKSDHRDKAAAANDRYKYY